MAWQDRAACKGLTHLFYSEERTALAKARNICDGCPVRRECLNYAITNVERYGVWAGLGRDGRRQAAQHRDQQKVA